MDTIYMSFTEFMTKQGPHLLGFPPEAIEKMGLQAMREEKDFLFVVRNQLITIPLISLKEYFEPKPVVVVAEEPKPEKGQKALKI